MSTLGTVERPLCVAVVGSGPSGFYAAEALLKAPNLETIKKLSRAAGNRTLQEEGVLLIAQGITSIAELQRVLKQ